uniref:phosphatase PAP2 family protein n=1 Tax=uncultured Sphingomonas sp. TaxID=158754 RepID=UPI0035C9D475
MRGITPIAAALLVAAAPVPKSAPLLGAGDLDPALLLPPPPAPDSLQAAAELVELRAAGAARTPAAEADARLDGDTKNASIFAVVLGPRFDLARLPATAALMALVRASEKAAVDRGKDHFQRPRPYIVDPRLDSCKHNEDPLSSYPSGHTSMAYSMAETLARLVPEKAGALLARAARYGQSRIVCEQHFRSDVAAGQTLGLLVAERLMTKATFQRAFTAARIELVAADIAAK